LRSVLCRTCLREIRERYVKPRLGVAVERRSRIPWRRRSTVLADTPPRFMTSLCGGSSRIMEPIECPIRRYPQGEAGNQTVINLSCWQR